MAAHSGDTRQDWRGTMQEETIANRGCASLEDVRLADGVVRPGAEWLAAGQVRE